jgi:tetratricopeptide (TPR) repeat protein
MSNLDKLVNSKLTKISQENIAQAGEKCSRADQCILQAREGSENSSGLVKEAIDLYQESLQLNSRQVQPYIGLAYISYSTGDLKTAIGLLNKAYDLEPENDRVNEMLFLFNEEYKQKNISGVISKVAGKSLSEKLGTDKKKLEFNLFEKITSVFIKSAKNRKAENTAIPKPNALTGEKINPDKSQPENFFEALRQVKK